MSKLFGTDGIRGVANKAPMTAEMALNIGRAVAHLLDREGHAPRIVIGRDTRISGDMLENAIVAGLCSMGADAIVAGILPTPGVAFLAGSLRADAGIVISASHNPYEDNGIKIFGNGGFKLPDETEAAIEELVSAERIPALAPSPAKLGRVSRMDDAPVRYTAFLKQSFPREHSLAGMKLVLDCANGAAYRVAPDAFSELGAATITLFNTPDGRNINLHCGSQHPEKLAKKVVESGADAGFAFDGDGDRVIAVDEKGNVLTGDRMLAICAKVMKNEGKLTNNTVVRTVMSNTGLRIALESLGIDSVITGVGDRLVIEAMKARGAALGGEDSGHLIFLEHHTTGDGIITALQVAAAMKKAGQPLSKLAEIMNVFPQVLVNVHVKSRPELAAIPAIAAAIRKAEARLRDQGRVLVRYSGTQHICRIMAEGPTQEETEQICRTLAAVIDKSLNV
ncbi:MAG: phosphoglucosamine mutase [Syntrophales bacterium]|jgi:phosphoglucosamine mutase|nr:phosphoglucosamine mutase [Syntrophales bacterium]